MVIKENDHDQILVQKAVSEREEIHVSTTTASASQNIGLRKKGGAKGRITATCPLPPCPAEGKKSTSP